MKRLIIALVIVILIQTNYIYSAPNDQAAIAALTWAKTQIINQKASIIVVRPQFQLKPVMVNRPLMTQSMMVVPRMMNAPRIIRGRTGSSRACAT